MNIFEFTTKRRITQYSSPVGNNDVPYPYAIDNGGRYYLLTENCSIMIPYCTKAKDDPYSYYYKHHVCKFSEHNNLQETFDNYKLLQKRQW